MDAYFFDEESGDAIMSTKADPGLSIGESWDGPDGKARIVVKVEYNPLHQMVFYYVRLKNSK